MRSAVVAAIAAVLVAAGLLVAGPVPQAEAGAVVKVRLRTAVKQLPVRAERRAGYDRRKFRHWIDADGDCRDTRAEVLAQESRGRVRGACTIRSGTWRSPHDRRTHRVAGDLDIDHMVPLAEAWDSGARRWNPGTRERFANDLGDRRSLLAMTAGLNRSKSDRDPGEWLPRYARCLYVRNWVAVKTRWSLSVDRAEKRTLHRQARRCANVRITVRKARVRRHKQRPGGGGQHTAPPRNWYPPLSTYRCPARAPIKGNESSMIYHPPSSPWYARTTPEKCFATERAARAAGFRRATY